TSIVTGNCGGSALDVGEFFRKIEETKVAINVATLFGHNTVRREAMGGSFQREPTEAELERMKARVERAVNDGAVGLSTGLIYLPGTFSKSEEIVALAKVAGPRRDLRQPHAQRGQWDSECAGRAVPHRPRGKDPRRSVAHQALRQLRLGPRRGGAG